MTLPISSLQFERMMESIFFFGQQELEADEDWDIVEHGFGAPRTPDSNSDTHDIEVTRNHQYDTSEPGSEDEYGGSAQGAPKRKKGGYDSRIEQILYENPDLPILIVDAGKSAESGGKYIVYTIRTGVGWNNAAGERLLMLDRIWRLEEDTPNSHPSETRCRDCTRP